MRKNERIIGIIIFIAKVSSKMISPLQAAHFLNLDMKKTTGGPSAALLYQAERWTNDTRLKSAVNSRKAISGMLRCRMWCTPCHFCF